MMDTIYQTNEKKYVILQNTVNIVKFLASNETNHCCTNIFPSNFYNSIFIENCEYCCINMNRCGVKKECSKVSVTFIAATVSIIVLLILILLTWCYVIHKRNLK